LNIHYVQRERYATYQNNQNQCVKPGFPSRPNKERPDQVKLFLDAERPQVQQQFGLGAVVEVTRHTPKNKIRDERRAAGYVFAELGVFIRQ